MPECEGLGRLLSFFPGLRNGDAEAARCNGKRGIGGATCIKPRRSECEIQIPLAVSASKDERRWSGLAIFYCGCFFGFAAGSANDQSMCELVHCPGCGELISESLPISECLTCLSSYPRDPLPDRSASAPPSGARSEITLFIFVIRNDELVSVSDYAIQGSGRSGRERNP